MLVISGRQVPVPGLESSNFLIDPDLGFLRKDYRLRKTDWVRSICIHTRMGINPQTHDPDTKDNRNWDHQGVKRANKDDRVASWHISIDADGSYVCHIDLAKFAAYHCGQLNDVSIGIEMYQSSTGNITPATLEACVKIVDVITREFKIQRQFISEQDIQRRMANGRKPTRKASASRRLAFMKGGKKGLDFVGVFGHRNATRNRGKGDPGDMIFNMLYEVGYERFDMSTDEDLEVWKVRQERLLMLPPFDGVPGPGTVRVIEADNQKHGLWIPRPGD